jgi:hypothetical protein
VILSIPRTRPRSIVDSAPPARKPQPPRSSPQWPAGAPAAVVRDRSRPPRETLPRGGWRLPKRPPECPVAASPCMPLTARSTAQHSKGQRWTALDGQSCLTWADRGQDARGTATRAAVRPVSRLVSLRPPVDRSQPARPSPAGTSHPAGQRRSGSHPAGRQRPDRRLPGGRRAGPPRAGRRHAGSCHAARPRTLHIDRERDMGEYWEPNIWLIHTPPGNMNAVTAGKSRGSACDDASHSKAQLVASSSAIAAAPMRPALAPSRAGTIAGTSRRWLRPKR